MMFAMIFKESTWGKTEDGIGNVSVTDLRRFKHGKITCRDYSK